MKALAFVLAVTALGCGGYDNRYLDRSRSFGGRPVANVHARDVPVRGFPVVVVPQDGREVEGELLAVDDVNVYVLDASDRSTVATRWDAVTEVRITVAPAREREPEGSIVWTSIGAASTVTHGFFLAITGPAWLGAGTVSYTHLTLPTTERV